MYRVQGFRVYIRFLGFRGLGFIRFIVLRGLGAYIRFIGSRGVGFI